MSDIDKKPGFALKPAADKAEQPEMLPELTIADAAAQMQDTFAAEALQEPTTSIVSEPVMKPAIKSLPRDSLAGLRSRLEEAAQNKAALEEEVYRREIESGEVVYRFTSIRPNFVVYIGSRRSEKRIDFRAGVYRTTDASEAEMIRALPAFQRHQITEVQDARSAALREQVANARAKLTTASRTGITASTDGSEAGFHAADHQLRLAENALTRPLVI